jgi:hypothetical protein
MSDYKDPYPFKSEEDRIASGRAKVDPGNRRIMYLLDEAKKRGLYWTGGGWCDWVDELEAQIESLQRSNEELRRGADVLRAQILERCICTFEDDGETPKTECILHAKMKVAAITPELREMIDNALDVDHEDCISTSAEPAHDAVNLLLRLRDILGMGEKG